MNEKYLFLSKHLNKSYDTLGFYCDICGEKFTHANPVPDSRTKVLECFWPHFKEHYNDIGTT